MRQSRSRRELGLVLSPNESFQLADDNTVASVTAAHRQACATAGAAVPGLSAGRRRDRPPGWAPHAALVYLQVLRELAHHCGHANILREQVLAG